DLKALEFARACRLQTCDTADCKSALRQGGDAKRIHWERVKGRTDRFAAPIYFRVLEVHVSVSGGFNCCLMVLMRCSTLTGLARKRAPPLLSTLLPASLRETVAV